MLGTSDIFPVVILFVVLRPISVQLRTAIFKREKSGTVFNYFLTEDRYLRRIFHDKIARYLYSTEETAISDEYDIAPRAIRTDYFK